MANPVAIPALATDIGTVLASCQFTGAAAGAVGAIKRAREFKAIPVTHPGTGRYVFAFKEIWWACIEASAATIQAAFALTGACDWYQVTDNAGVDGTIEMNVRRKDTGALVDLAVGDIVKAVFVMQKLKPTVI
jgi:hypothetical protein